MHRSGQADGNIYLPELATIVRTEPVTAQEALFELRLDSGQDLGHMPGQFVEVSIAGFGEAPISVSSSPTQAGSFELVVRRVGSLTGALHRMKAGDKLGVRGPFGTNFPVDDAMKGRDLLFITGGIGLVPVRSAIRYVLDHRDDYGKVTILFGTRTPAERLFVDELAAWGRRDDVLFQETVDRAAEGWTGNVGVVTSLMPPLAVDPAQTTVIVCGPPIMYKFVLLSLEDMRIDEKDIYVSLERRMKCGVGKCGHCQIDGHYCCQDGPVFKFADVSGIREAIK